MSRSSRFALIVSCCALLVAYLLAASTKSEGTNSSVSFNGTSSVDVLYKANLNVSGVPAVVLPPQGGGYTYSRTITIDHSKVPNTDQSNFPVLISGTYSYLATTANGGNVQNANGYDVIFTSDSGCATKLNHEVQNYTPTTGAVNYWVKVPTVSHTSDTVIYLCYGNASITTDQSNKTAVWDSNYKGVWHLDDNATNTTVSDSTSSNNGTNQVNTSSKTATGKVGKALTYNGSSDYTDLGTNVGNYVLTDSFTVESWVNATLDSANHAIYGNAYALAGYLLRVNTANKVRFVVVTNGSNFNGRDSSTLSSGWHHVVAVYTGSGTPNVYIDGVLDNAAIASGGTVTSITTSAHTRIGAAPESGYESYFNGTIDEVRSSKIARSADWIKTEYNNQSSPATFYSISAITNCGDTSLARLDPMNATGGGGENPLSRNFNWNLPLVSLPGRAGMDLDLSLSYNSLVWTKSGNCISFDDDRGFPSPGFRLGFPTIQSFYLNPDTNKWSYLLIGSDGGRTELRQVATNSVLYESADSSHLLLDTTNLSSGDPSMLLRTTDGSQLTYKPKGPAYECTEVKDRNGNYITINYNSSGRISNIHDTLDRMVTFNYDAGYLTSISQDWNGQAQSHNWASFVYSNPPDLAIQTNFSGLTVLGPSAAKVLQKVTLADGSYFSFDYTSWGQIQKIRNFASDGLTLLNYRSYNLPVDSNTVAYDCPRFTERHDWAAFWNGDTDATASSSEEAITTYGILLNQSWTMPDGSAASGTVAQVGLKLNTTTYVSSDNIYFIGAAGNTTTGWQRGLPALVITYDETNTWQRKVMTKWVQDSNASYIINPRIEETNVYDTASNRKRTSISYQTVNIADGTTCRLPQDVYEYQADPNKVLRRTHTDYNLATAYTTRRIIGLPSEKTLYEADPNTQLETLRSKVGFQYDESGSIQGTAAPVQHDNMNYGSGFIGGRGNLSSVKRYDVNNTTQFTTTTTKYNAAGSVVSSADALSHTVTLSYADSFSDNGSRNTLAYPTTVTDPDNFASSAKYNFDFGSVTWRQTPSPNVNLPAPEFTLQYDSIGRLQKTTNNFNNAYTRYIYGPNYVESWSTVNTVADEAHALQVFDGAGRVIGKATNHPGSVGGFSGLRLIYDIVGRVVQESNPTETSVSITAAPINPSSWSALGDDDPNANPNPGFGWIFKQQTYDWKGRPLVTTNTDNSTRSVSYSVCGCAGGEVVTLTDEGTIYAGAARKRQQKIYSDVLGRTIKTEILNWDGTGPNGTAPNNTVYSATVNTYNARDQVIQAREYAGPEGSGTYQDTTMNYDGYGRLQLKHVPEQNAGTFTTWVYNTDDTVQSITDARGATTTFTYNNARHLPNVITHTLSGSSTITESFNYDAPRNRTSMTDGFGNVSYEYDQLSRLKSETRTLTGVTNPNSADGKFKLSYDYNLAGELKTITDPWNATINYGFDLIGRMSNVSGTNYSAGIINNIAYRAWGAPKQITYGNSRIASTTYNSRMQASHFEVPSVGALPSVMSIDYQYNADGRIEYSHNILDPRFDRSYEYDHATRITTALSGAEARGEPATTDRPYNETFDHDAFDHLTSRDTESWSKLRGFYSNDSYTNNRRNAWVYDAQGNLTNDLKRQYTYNAAAQETLISSSSSSLSQFFDGLGNRIKTIEFGIGTYYLWSTPLGQVVSELNSSGAKQRGYVYAGGKLIADGLIVHDEVSGTSVRKTDAQSGYTILFDELDPMGADAYTEDPYVANPNFGGRGEGGPVYPGYGNISMPSTGCTLDGVYIPCDMADRVLSQGAAMQCPNNDCSPRRVDIDIRDRFGGSQQRSGLVANPFFDINLVFFGGRAQAAYNAYIEAGSFQSGVYDGIKAGLEYTENQHANPQNTSPTPQVANSTGAQVDPCRSLMSNPEQWQSYVNDVVFNGVDNVAMNPPYKIDTGTQSSGDFLNSLKNAGWWWPSNRPNLNREHAGGTNLQREVEAGKWIHITVFPGQSEVTTRSLSGKSGTIKYGTKKVDDWNKLPRDIQLHCERGWLQPSSFKHLKDFLLN